MRRFLILVAALGLVVACGPSVETRTTPADDKVLVRVPAGEFTMGLTAEQEKTLIEKEGGSADGFNIEKPAHTVNVADFWIDRYLVTNAEYKKFIDANSDYPVPDTEIEQLKSLAWDGVARTFPSGRDFYPVVLVSWFDARAYCQWAGKRLPTEAEWEKAARGTDARLYPWGNEWGSDKSAAGQRGALDASAVGKFPSDASPYTAHDMVGNVWQWTNSLWKPYPYDANDGREDQNAQGERVVRGGMFAFGAAISRVNVRNKLAPTDKSLSVGFRCAQ